VEAPRNARPKAAKQGDNHNKNKQTNKKKTNGQKEKEKENTHTNTLKASVARKLKATINHSLGQVPLQAARKLGVQVTSNESSRIPTTSSFQVRPLPQCGMHSFRGATQRLPRERDKVDPLLFTQLQGLQQLPVVRILRSHSRLLHRNFNSFLLQRVSDSDVESACRESSVILLDSDVSRLDIRTYNLVFLLDNHSGKTSRASRMT